MQGTYVAVSFTKNLGNYQSLRVEIGMEREQSNDTLDTMIETASAFAREACGEKLTQREEQILEVYRQEEQQRVALSMEKRG